MASQPPNLLAQPLSSDGLADKHAHGYLLTHNKVLRSCRSRWPHMNHRLLARIAARLSGTQLQLSSSAWRCRAGVALRAGQRRGVLCEGIAQALLLLGTERGLDDLAAIFGDFGHHFIRRRAAHQHDERRATGRQVGAKLLDEVVIYAVVREFA